MADFYTYWRMTINNPDERDYALVKMAYPDDIRKIVWTPEEGANGTPHIQAFIQMKRSVRLSHMKKLFPGANFGASNSAEWRLNQHNYPQKDDETTRGPHVIQNNDPLHTIEGTLRRVVERIISDHPDLEDLEISRRLVERAMVVEDYTMAKVFVSSTYKTMWRDFGHEIYECLFKKREQEQEVRVPMLNTHTHTHTGEKFSHGGGIDDANDSEGESESESGDVSEGGSDQGDEDSEGEETERSSEGGSVSGGSQDDCEGSGEQSDWE